MEGVKTLLNTKWFLRYKDEIQKNIYNTTPGMKAFLKKAFLLIGTLKILISNTKQKDLFAEVKNFIRNQWRHKEIDKDNVEAEVNDEI